jgi:hypothetical protein
MIVKVQRPLFPPDGPWFVRNKNRTINIMLSEGVPEIGNDLKAYFRADYTNGKLKLIERVPDEPW